MADQVTIPTTCAAHGKPVIATVESFDRVVPLCEVCATCDADGCGQPGKCKRGSRVLCLEHVIEFTGTRWPCRIVYRPTSSGGAA